MDSSPISPAVVARFLSSILSDEAEGRRRDFEHYAAPYPDDVEELLRVWNELDPGPADTQPEDELHEALPDGGRLGAYRLLKPIGRGGQGDVYLAVDERLGRRVAVKTLRGLGAVSPELLTRFRREAELASRLEHPGICSVFDTGIENGTPYIVMRYVEGHTLSSHLARQRSGDADSGLSGPDPATQSDRTPSSTTTRMGWVGLMEKVGRATHAAHEAGVIHRDLKASNIVVTPEGEPVILDFGIARLSDGVDDGLTRTGEVFGTPAYLAPEVVSGGAGAWTRRADVWALGVTLYECLAGRRPFEAPTHAGLFAAIQKEEPPSVAGLPRDLGVVLRTALEKDPSRRYATAGALAEDLRRVRLREPILARPLGPWYRLRRWVQRHPSGAALVGMSMILALGLGVAAVLGPALIRDAQQRRALARSEEIERLLQRGFIGLTTEGREDVVRSEFLAILKLDPQNVEAGVGMMLASMRRKDAREAGEWIEKLGEWGAPPDVLVNLRHQLEGAKGTEPETPEAMAESSALGFLVAGLTQELRAFHGDSAAAQRALSALQSCLLTAPQARMIYHFHFVTLAARAGDQERATEGAAAMVRLWPTESLAWLGAGRGLQEVDPAGSLPYLEKALELDPDLAPAVYWLGAAHVKLGHLEQALETLKPLINGGVTGLPLLTVANGYEARGDFVRAAECARVAANIEPHNPIAWGDLGRYLAQASQWDASATASAKALSILPAYYDAECNLLAVLNELGRYSEAITLGEQAIQHRPAEPEAYSNLATSYYRLGRMDRAIELARHALSLAPDRPRLANNLVVILRHAGRHVAELEALQEAEARLGPVIPEKMMAQAQLMAQREREWDALKQGGDLPDDPRACLEMARVAGAQGDVAWCGKLLAHGMERMHPVRRERSEGLIQEIGRTIPRIVRLLGGFTRARARPGASR